MALEHCNSDQLAEVGSFYFAQLRPANQQALELYRQTLNSLETDKSPSPCHLGFFDEIREVTETAPSSCLQFWEILKASDQLSPPPRRKVPCYVLGLGNAPTDPIEGWTVGFSSAADLDSQRIAIILGEHTRGNAYPIIVFSIRFSLESGAVILESRLDDESLEVLEDNEWKPLKKGEKRVMYHRAQTLRVVHRFVYSFAFDDLAPESIKRLIEARDQYLKSHKDPNAIHPAEVFPPVKTLCRRQNTIFVAPLDVSESSYSYSGVDVTTGQRTLIKEYMSGSNVGKNSIELSGMRGTGIDFRKFKIPVSAIFAPSLKILFLTTSSRTLGDSCGSWTTSNLISMPESNQSGRLTSRRPRLARPLRTSPVSASCPTSPDWPYSSKS